METVFNHREASGLVFDVDVRGSLGVLEALIDEAEALGVIGKRTAKRYRKLVADRDYDALYCPDLDDELIEKINESQRAEKLGVKLAKDDYGHVWEMPRDAEVWLEVDDYEA